MALLARATSMLEEAGAGSGRTVVDRVATTLRTISTTGAWGGAAPGQLAKELDESDLASIATLLVDDAVRPKSSVTRSPSEKPGAGKPAPTAKHAPTGAQPRSSHERVSRTASGAAASTQRSAASTPRSAAPKEGNEAAEAKEAKEAKESKESKEAAAAAAKRRAESTTRARAALAQAEVRERDARTIAERSAAVFGRATEERERKARDVEERKLRAAELHRQADQAARAAKEAALEVKQASDELAALERAEVAAQRAARGAGIVAEDAAAAVAVAAAALETASRG